MPKPFIESPVEAVAEGDEPLELDLLIRIKLVDPDKLANVTQQAHIMDQLEDVFTTMIAPHTEGVEILSVDIFDDYEDPDSEV